ncbi:hypothetical protein ACFX2A_007249 [Malus domestica]
MSAYSYNKEQLKIPINLNHEKGITAIKQSLNSHLSTFVLVFSIWVKSREEGKLKPIGIFPVVGMTIQSDKAQSELGLDPNLRFRLSAPSHFSTISASSELAGFSLKSFQGAGSWLVASASMTEEDPYI